MGLVIIINIVLLKDIVFLLSASNLSSMCNFLYLSGGNLKDSAKKIQIVWIMK